MRSVHGSVVYAVAGDNDDAFDGSRISKRSGPVDPGHLPRYGRAPDGTPWVLRQIGAAQVEGICRAKIRIEPDAILGRHSNSEAVLAAVIELRRAADGAAAAGGEPETLDPIADLKVSTLDLVTAIRERQTLLARRAAMPCHRCVESHASCRSLLSSTLDRVHHTLVSERCMRVAGGLSPLASKHPAVPLLAANACMVWPLVMLSVAGNTRAL